MDVDDIETDLAAGDLRGIENAFRALVGFPGEDDIDGGETADHLSRLLRLCAEALAADDRQMPGEAREVLDHCRSKSMANGFHTGKINRRGVTTRAPRDGGELERREAGKYRAWSKVVGNRHPFTARALDTLVRSYEADARRHDEDVERFDWGSS